MGSGPAWERGDRRVRHTRLRVRDRAVQQRAAFSLSEALRLAHLPGEDEGRSYYFRYVAIKNLPADGNRLIWQTNVQRVLESCAQRAVHAADWRASSADAVYFFSRQEALEALLRKIVRREPSREWFWPLVLGTAAASVRSAPIVEIVEEVCAEAGSWTRVAQMLFGVLEPSELAGLAVGLPVSHAVKWLRELSARDAVERRVVSVRLTTDAQRVLGSVVQRLGSGDPRTLWLAAMAVLSVHPATFGADSPVSRARAVLRELALAADAPSEHGKSERDESAPERAHRRRRSIEFYDEVQRIDVDGTLSTREARVTNVAEALQAVDGAALEPAKLSERVAADTSLASELAELYETVDAADTEAAVTAREAPGMRALSDPGASDLPVLKPASGGPLASDTARVLEPALSTAVFHDAADAPERRIFGKPTTGAGLFFLLNAMARLGIARRLGADVGLAESGFVPRLLERLAVHAGIERTDVVFRLLASELAPFVEALDDRSRDDSDLLAAWSHGVRRWCRQMTGMTVREIVLRDGRVSLSRTDLDVSLRLDDADIRIRRIGLDLDPGWLPWFGRVVRFHYTHADPSIRC